MTESHELSAIPSPIRPRVKVWFESENGFGFGAGLVRILQEVETAGSIKAAAVRLDQSYRHVWGRLKRAELGLGRTLVESQIGGPASHRSGLTEEGRRIVAQYLELRDRLLKLVDRETGRETGSPLVSNDQTV